KKKVEEKPTKVAENDAKPKKKKRFRTTKIALLILALVIISIIAIVLFTDTKEEEVREVVSKEADEAECILDELKLKVEKEMTFSEDVEEGYVTKTTPVKEKKIKETSIVKMFVSDGKETLKMDDYVGDKVSQVEKILEGLGFEDIIAYEKESDRPVGEILTLIQQAPKSDVVTSETKVIFEISGDRKSVV